MQTAIDESATSIREKVDEMWSLVKKNSFAFDEYLHFQGGNRIQVLKELGKEVEAGHLRLQDDQYFRAQ